MITIVALYYSFLGAHGEFGGRAIKVLIWALVATAVAYVLNRGGGATSEEASEEVSAF